MNINRFPIEPTSTYYKSTAYNINSGGRPLYRAYPISSQTISPEDDLSDWFEGD